MLLQVSDARPQEVPVLETRPNSSVNTLNDHLTAVYAGQINQTEVAVRTKQSVRCKSPAVPTIPGSGIYYFEVTIKSKGMRGGFFIGLTDKGFQVTKAPGSTRKSYALRWDGKPYHGNSYNTYPALDVSMKKDDVVGCGLHFDHREIFYTYNGKHLGTVFSDVELREYYATVGFSSFNEQATCNFIGPFTFDLEGMIREHENRLFQDVLKEPISFTHLQDLVHTYLLHQGYADSLLSFEQATGYTPGQEMIDGPGISPRKRTSSVRISEALDPIILADTNSCGICGSESNSKVCQDCLKTIVARVEPSSPVKLPLASPSTSRKSSEQPFALRMERCDSMDLSTFYLKEADPEVAPARIGSDFSDLKTIESVKRRGNIRRLIGSGEIEEAETILQEHYPGLIDTHPRCRLALQVQKFIELLSRGLVADALFYAREHLRTSKGAMVLCRKGTDQEVPLYEVLGLLCYRRPDLSSLAHLMEQGQRDLTADIVNEGVLGKA